MKNAPMIEEKSEGKYTVSLDGGKTQYNVVRTTWSGKLFCDCKTFNNAGECRHTAAVTALCGMI